MDVNRIILKHYRVFFIHVYQISVQISNTIGVLSNFRRLVINEHELIIQDKAEGHYPQLVINPHEMSGIEIVITILMKKKEKKKARHFEAVSISKEFMFLSSPNQAAGIICNPLYSLFILLQFSCQHLT